MKRPTLLPQTLIFSMLCFAQKCLSDDDPKFQACKPTTCGDQKIVYPFWVEGVQPSYCGFPGFNVSCDAATNRTVIDISGVNYTVDRIFYNNQSLRVSIGAPSALNSSCDCSSCAPLVKNMTLPGDRFALASGHSELLLFSNCSTKVPGELGEYAVGKCSASAAEGNGTGAVLAVLGGSKEARVAAGECSSRVAVPVRLYGNESGALGDWERYEEVVRRGVLLVWTAPDCSVCAQTGGRCGFEEATYHFKCFCPDRPHVWHCVPPPSNGKRRSVKVGIAVGVSVIGLLIICSIFVGFWYCNRRKFGPTNFLSVRTSSNPSSKSSLERDNAFFGVPVFKYDDLQKATNYFDEANELGDGGYGTVYHGQLQDGREVAVKRLYDNNYKRVEQFVNEIKILTLLRHKNLVTLYGCTSRRSRELLLVYEFISNGTVADHLHCERPSSLTWPVRLRIAIETASALAYLHASDIIHRDVKTSNILLDNNFSVKVADFGLSRLFPNDVTHISTAPQGTPGYVDPEYHQCYQLTEKSDVYSFGVVLIELISSLPAVDISRDRDEINLSNLAVNRIQNKAFHHLVDPCLGFESDCGVRRMTILVAELACQCLQLDREERPSMDDVLGALRRIYDEGYGREKTEQAGNIGAMTSCVVRPPASPESEDGVLLKRLHLLTSPTSVTDKWVSQSTTPNISV